MLLRLVITVLRDPRWINEVLPAPHTGTRLTGTNTLRVLVPPPGHALVVIDLAVPLITKYGTPMDLIQTAKVPWDSSTVFLTHFSARSIAA